jgi:hypothetical protein
MTTLGGRAALGAAVIVVAACGAQHTSSAAKALAGASSPAPHSISSATTAAGAVLFPDQLLGQTKNTSAAGKQAASILDRQYVSHLAADLVGANAAIYGGGQNGATPFFFVVAGTLARRITSPDNAAHVLQNSMLSRGISGAKLFPAGPNGVALACGQTHMDILCGWADHVSFGIVLYSPGFTSSLNDGASKTSQIRSAVVH